MEGVRGGSKNVRKFSTVCSGGDGRDVNMRPSCGGAVLAIGYCEDNGDGYAEERGSHPTPSVLLLLHHLTHTPFKFTHPTLDHS